MTGGWLRLLAAVGPMGVAIAAGVIMWQLGGGDGSSNAEAVRIRSNLPTYNELSPLLSETDLVFVGTVTSAQPGRIFSDPNDPDAGLRSQLVELDVHQNIVDVTQRTYAPEVIIEQETELLDGTPLFVDDIAPLAIGDKVLVFLIAGVRSDEPYFSLVGPQGLYYIGSDEAQTLQAAGIAGSSPDIESFDGLPLNEAVARITATFTATR